MSKSFYAKITINKEKRKIKSLLREVLRVLMMN